MLTTAPSIIAYRWCPQNPYLYVKLQWHFAVRGDYAIAKNTSKIYIFFSEAFSEAQKTKHHKIHAAMEYLNRNTYNKSGRYVFGKAMYLYLFYFFIY